MFEATTLIGLGVVAMWAYLRYPAMRPTSLARAGMHVAVSFIGFMLVPTVLQLTLPVAPTHALRVSLALALLFPLLTYMLLSWVWLVARILQDIGGNPRGGHPVSTKT